MIPNFLDRVRPELLEAMGLNDVTWDQCNVMVVVGDNASGKSLLRRLFQAFLHDEEGNPEVMHLSQQGRANPGFGRCFIYGSEDDEATSVISARTLIKGMQTSRGREKPHFMVYDEPEIGMSEESALGASLWIKEQLTEDWPKHLNGFIVCTHNRHFATCLMELPNSKFVWMHQPDATIQDWIGREIVPINPQELMDAGHSGRRKFSGILRS